MPANQTATKVFGWLFFRKQKRCDTHPSPRHGGCQIQNTSEKKKDTHERALQDEYGTNTKSLVRNVQINLSACVAEGEKGKGVHVVRSKTASINVHLRLARQTRPVNRASTTFGRLSTLLGVSAHAS